MSVSKVELVVLGLVAEEPRYGYELLERFRERSMGEWVEVGKASVYQALKRLEQRRLVVGRSLGPSSGPRRRGYRITTAGRGELRTALLEYAAVASAYESDGDVALGFAHLLSAEDGRRALAARASALEARHAELDAERARLISLGSPEAAIAARALELQAAFVDAETAWLARLRPQLAKLRR